MVGIIIRYQGCLVVATGYNREEAEEIILQLFNEQGIDLDGVEMSLIVFDPSTRGGVLLNLEEEEEGIWTEDGWQPY